MRVAERKRRGLERAALQGGVDFRRRYGRRDRADGLHRLAETRQSAHAHALPVVERFGRIADAHELVLRRERGEERSEEHTSERQSRMRISDDVFCLNKKTTQAIQLT